MSARFAAPLVGLVLVLAAAGCAPPDSGRVPGASRAGQALRIVSLAPHLTELVYSAGAGERLVGVVDYSDYPPEAARLPRVGDAFRVDMERLVRLDPDLVLAWSGGSSPGLIAQIEALGFRVVDLTPTRLADIAAHVREIGRLAGTTEVADARAEAFLLRLEALRYGHAHAAPIDVFYQISARPIYTVNAQHPISQLISLCGGVNVFASVGQLAPAVTRESVLAADPEVLLAGDDDASALDGWRRWSSLRAVQLGNAYLVDADVVARSSVRILDGARQICDALGAARLSRDRASTALRNPLPDAPGRAQSQTADH